MVWLWWRRFSTNAFYLPGHYSSDLIGTMMASSAKVRPFNWLSVQEMFWTEGGNTWDCMNGESKPFFVVTPPVATFMLFGYGVALLNCRSLQSLLAAYSFLASCLLYWHFGVSNCLSRAHSFSSHIPKKPNTCKTSIATICHHHHQCHGTFHVWMQDCLKALWRTPGAYRM